MLELALLLGLAADAPAQRPTFLGPPRGVTCPADCECGCKEGEGCTCRTIYYPGPRPRPTGFEPRPRPSSFEYGGDPRFDPRFGGRPREPFYYEPPSPIITLRSRVPFERDFERLELDFYGRRPRPSEPPPWLPPRPSPRDFASPCPR